MRVLLCILVLSFGIISFGQVQIFKVVKENTENVDYPIKIVKVGFGAPELQGIEIDSIVGELYLTKVSKGVYYIQGNSNYVLKIDYEYKNITIVVNGKLVYNLLYSSYKEKKK